MSETLQAIAAPPKQAAVAYLRVSTRKQAEAQAGAEFGLGIEAQRGSVEAYCRMAGLEITRTFTEVESGKKNDRPELMKALKHCQRTKAKLVIAKIDRLSRNVAFLANLMETKVDFACCDNPSASPVVLHIMAALAENEAKLVSQRTKAALAVLKANGVRLGAARPGHWEKIKDRFEAGAEASAARRMKIWHEKSLEKVSDLLPIMREQRASGATFDAIAKNLCAEGYTTARGNPWTAMGVRQTMSRFA
jgi:DNA invertase Pin-like site-specific DNA recombinase